MGICVLNVVGDGVADGDGDVASTTTATLCTYICFHATRKH